MAATPKKTTAPKTAAPKKGTALAQADAPAPKKAPTAKAEAIVAEAPSVHGTTIDSGSSAKKPKSIVTLLALSAIKVRKGFNPRATIRPEELEELTASIKKHGVLAGITVTPNPNKEGEFEVLAGEKRWRSAMAAGLDTIPVTIRLDLDDPYDAKAAAMAENSEDGRSPLNAIEMGREFANFEKAGWSVEKISKETSTNSATVRRCLHLARASVSIQKQVASGELGARAALELVKLPEELQKQVQKQLKDTEMTEDAIKIAAKSLAKQDEASAAGAQTGKANNQKKGAARAASVNAWRGNKAASDELGRLCSKFHAVTDQNDMFTQEWHEMRGAIAVILYLRADFAEGSAPSVESTNEADKKILVQFGRLVEDEAKKYNKANAAVEANAATNA